MTPWTEFDPSFTLVQPVNIVAVPIRPDTGQLGDVTEVSKSKLYMLLSLLIY